MVVDAVATAKVIKAALKKKRKCRKSTLLQGAGREKLKNNQNARGARTCRTFSGVIRNRMNEAQREELRRVTMQAADEQWSACWNEETQSGSSQVGENRPYAYLGKAKLRNVPLARILYFLNLSELSDALKKECAEIWNSKNNKQRTTTLKMFADEALQVCTRTADSVSLAVSLAVSHAMSHAMQMSTGAGPPATSAGTTGRCRC